MRLLERPQTDDQTHCTGYGEVRLALTLKKYRFLRRFNPASVIANPTNRQIECIHHTQNLSFTKISPGDILLSP